MSTLDLAGRILFFCDDGDRIRSQLAGTELSQAEAGELRHDISTDEITPIPSLTYYDHRLGHYVYTGLKAGNDLPISIDAIRNGGFRVVVGGRRYGKGSSREHSPAAELHAGIRLVIAESFERIYRQNADNCGLFTSTDFTLIERIRRGEVISIEELTKPRDKLAGAILRSGGLLRYGHDQMRNIGIPGVSPPNRPMTLAEKILVRRLVKTDETTGSIVPGEGAFVKADWRFIIEVYTGMAADKMHATFGKPLKLVEPATIITFAEHFSYTHKSPAHLKNNLIPGIRVVHQAHEDFARDYGLTAHSYLKGQDGSQGICHPMMTESYALPGQLVVGTDSHTPHSGSLGCLAFGVGTTDMANAMLTGAVRLTVPETLRVDFNGKLPQGLTGKDMVLKLLAHPAIRRGIGVGKVFEFAGPIIRALSIDERATLTNMAAELGGFTGIIEPDERTVQFLKERRGIDFILESWMRSDPGAQYVEVIEIDCGALSPMVAAPGDPGNGISLAEVKVRPKIDIAFAGSCTGGKRADFDGYFEVLSWAAERGLKVADGVRLYLQFGTSAVRDHCVERGYMATFEKVGAVVMQPACGACANLGPGSSDNSNQITVSAQNRNFPGRSGPGQVWLASPPTVAASAIAGELVSFEELRERIF